MYTCWTMRVCVALVAVLTAGLTACGSGSQQSPPAEAPKQAETPKPPDESRRFPTGHLVSSNVVDQHLLDKPFMPGGTIAHYKKGKSEYQMFAAKLASPTDSAILLPDWRKALTGAKFEPAFGGYFGQDGSTPVFVFVKGSWIAGIAGLPEKVADLQARELAAHLD